MRNFLQAPFPWFGGKSKVADVVWRAFGSVNNYVEPFFGSGAVLLGAPKDINRLETINDKDGYISNFWRAIQHAPDEVAHYAINPVNENDLHARHIYLCNQKEKLVQLLEGNPDYYNSKIAGYWVWGVCLWIGSGFCSGKGAWSRVKDKDGNHILIQKSKNIVNNQGVTRQTPNLGNAGKGVCSYKSTINKNIGVMASGISRANTYLNGKEQGFKQSSVSNHVVFEWFNVLSERLRNVRVCSGDWKRVCTKTVTYKSHGLTGVFLDPPYSTENVTDDTYTEGASKELSKEIRQWCIENQDNPLMRISLCGYKDDYDLPGWQQYRWDGNKGMNITNSNRYKETIWFNKSCLIKDISKKMNTLF